MAGSVTHRNKERRKHLTSVLILLIVLGVFAVSAVGRLQLKQKISYYQERETALQEAIDKEEERAQEIAELEVYTKTKKYVEDVAKEKLGLVYEDEIIYKARQ